MQQKNHTIYKSEVISECPMILGVKQKVDCNDDKCILQICPLLLEVKDHPFTGETDVMSCVIGGENHRMRDHSL